MCVVVVVGGGGVEVHVVQWKECGTPLLGKRGAGGVLLDRERGGAGARCLGTRIDENLTGCSSLLYVILQWTNMPIHET